MSIPVLVTALLALLSLPTDVHVHGYLSSPRSREQNESNSVRGSNAEAAPAEEDEITSSGDIINSPVDPRLATKIFSQSDRGLKQKYPVSSKDYKGPIVGGREFKFDPKKQIEVHSSPDSTIVDTEPIRPVPVFLCPEADTYTSLAGDSGVKIALKFYPGDDPKETWAYIIACNKALQDLYKDLYPGDKMTIHYDTVDKMELVIPDKQAMMQALVIGNTTTGELVLDANTNVTDEMNLFDDEDSGGRRLMTEGYITSLGRYSGKSKYDWDQYQCVPMYSRDHRSTVIIITGNNPNCERMWNRINDRCSSPVWSAFIWEHTPACQRHDACYWLSSHYDQIGRPKSIESRRLCDVRFKHDMLEACDWHWSNNWVVWPFCRATAGIWGDAVWNEQENQRKPTTPIGDFFPFDGQASSLKQIWRPWDWRMPANIQYARSFLEHPARISSMMNGKVLTAERSNAVSYVSMFPWNSGSWNRQGFVRRGTYTSLNIQQVDSNFCLDVIGYGGPGTRVVTYPCNNYDNQKWFYDDIQRLHPVHREDLCLDINSGSDSDGAFLLVWWCHGGSNQQWYI